ncbi:hypothetical protein ACT5P2_002622 [Salmonella enterica subsp. enterica serovar Newport]
MKEIKLTPEMVLSVVDYNSIIRRLSLEMEAGEREDHFDMELSFCFQEMLINKF